MLPQKQKDAKATARPIDNVKKPCTNLAHYPTLRLRLKPKYVQASKKTSLTAEASKSNKALNNISKTKQSTSVRQRQVKFGDDVLESRTQLQGKPCCVHPRLFKDGTAPCSDTSCRDHSISLTEIEQLLGINLSEYITDDQFALMRQRIANQENLKKTTSPARGKSAGSKKNSKSTN